MEIFYIYILYSELFDRYYIGSSRNPWKRLEEHNTSVRNIYTSKYRPWTLVAVFETGNTRSGAVFLERYIKRQKSRKLITLLCDADFRPTGVLAKLVRVPHLRD